MRSILEVLSGEPADRAGTHRRCAVLGHPVGHSLSPVLHRAAYRALGLDWSYEAVDVRSEELAALLDGLDRSWRGLSLTMPLKRTVVPLVGELSDQARLAGAVNTVLLEPGRRVGHNTDVPGAAAAVTERLEVAPRSVAVLGGGATAASALLALADLGCDRATLVVREPRRAEETLAAVARHPHPPRTEVARLDEWSGDVDLLVSTIPASAQAPQVVALAARAAAVFDVVYDPWPTPLAARARATGRPLVSGLDLLVHQAVLQLRLMTGRDDVPLEVLRTAGKSALAART